MGSSNSRIRSSSPSTSPKVNRPKPRRFSSFVCGCSSSHAPLEMEDYPDECLVSPSELCPDPLFSEVQKPKEELHSISTRETVGLIYSDDEPANSSITMENEGHGNLVQADSGDCEVSNHGNRLSESAELVPPPLVSVCSPGGLDRDSNNSTSSTLFEDPQSSEVVSVHISSNSTAEYGDDDLVTSGASEIQHKGDDVISEVEIPENEGAESRAVDGELGRGSTSTELVPMSSEFPLYDREQGLETESMGEVDVISASFSPLALTAANSTTWDGRRSGRRSFLDVITGHSSRGHDDSDTAPIFFSSPDDSDYERFRERWMFDHTDLLSDDGARPDSRQRGSWIQRSNERRRRRRFEFLGRLRSGLYEHNVQNTSCPLGLHTDGNVCSCDRYLAEESRARSSISRIVMLAEALFEVLDEIHRQPLSFLDPVTAPESIVDSFPLKSYEKSCNPADSEEDSVEQCNICFAEYEEGDKIRVLPCHHEYHMECVDKWLKEIHGVCPLCRGDVCEGFTEASASTSEVASS